MIIYMQSFFNIVIDIEVNRLFCRRTNLLSERVRDMTRQLGIRRH